MTSVQELDNRERDDLLETLSAHRWFLRQTVQGLTDEQAARPSTLATPTSSENPSMVPRPWAK